MKKYYLNTVKVFCLFLAIGLGPSVVLGRSLVFYLENVRGTVEYQVKGSTQWNRAHARMPVKPGYSIRTGDDGKAVIRFSPDNFSLLAANSTVTISEATAQPSLKNSKLDVFKKDKTKISLKQKDGSMFFLLDGLDKNQKFEVVTPVAVVGVRGTHFASILPLTDSGGGVGNIAVFRGAGDVTPTADPNQAFLLGNGQQGSVTQTTTDKGAISQNLYGQYRKSRVDVQVTNTDPNKQVRSNEITNSKSTINSLSELSINNRPSLLSSLNSFISSGGSTSAYSNLNSFHPIADGSTSWQSFNFDDVQDFWSKLRIIY